MVMRMRSPECQRIAMLEAYGYRTDSHFLLANLLKKPVRPWPDRPDRPLRPWVRITSVSWESMSHGITACTTYSIQTILFKMEEAVFPAANVAHNIIHRILLSNCQPQPLMTLRPGSVGITDSNKTILQ